MKRRGSAAGGRTESGWTLVETALGPFGLAWTPRGVRGTTLPGGSSGEAREHLRARLEDPYPEPAIPPPGPLRDLPGRIARHLSGTPDPFDDLPLDLEGIPPFHSRVYQAAQRILPGTTMGYGELAALAGSPGAARAVGQAMARNPLPLLVPCHRVLAAGGRPGGFNAPGALTTKARLLALEGVVLGPRGRRPSPDHGLAWDPEEAVAFLRSADPALARWIDRIGPCLIQARPTEPIFKALVRAIAYQQLTGKAAATILGRVLALFPGVPFPGPEDLASIPETALRGAGLSGPKIRAIRDLSARTLDGTVPGLEAAASMDDEALVERLTVVRGIGRWSVEMLLMFGLGRPDVLAVTDYGLRKGYQAVYRGRDLPDARSFTRTAERWRPFRTAACWYLWRVSERV